MEIGCADRSDEGAWYIANEETHWFSYFPEEGKDEFVEDAKGKTPACGTSD